MVLVHKNVSTGDLRERRYDKYVWPLAIIFIGVSLRLYSFYHSFAVNWDGMLYIQQARAFYSGQYGSLTECYPYLNALPLFISFGYLFTGDWLVAAKAVSLFFGSVLMIPLYLLLRQFLSVSIASCTLLAFAVNPFFVQMSNEVIRGPAAWFCIILGMYLFSFADSKKYGRALVLSCISFCCASLFRVEEILFLPATLAFMLFFTQEKKLQKITFFLSPLVSVALLSLSSLSFLGFDFSQWFYPRSIWDRLTFVFQNYQYVRHGLVEIAAQQSLFWQQFFFPKVRNLLWWLGIGVVLVETTRAFFEPFFLLFICGFKGSVQRIKEKRMLAYLLFLSCASFLLLYVNVLGHWIMRQRFVAIFLFPSFVLVGFGLDNLSSYLSEKFKIRKITLIVLLGIFIFLCALPRNLSENKVQRKVYQEIGATIAAEKEVNQNVTVVGALDETNLRLVNFFSNLNVFEATCVAKLNARVNPKSFSVSSKEKNLGGDYLLWDEKNWPANTLENIRKSTFVTYKEIKTWNDPSEGLLVLFQINPDE